MRRTLGPVLLVLALLLSSTAFAQLGGRPDSGGAYEPPSPTADARLPRGEKPCENAHPEWRDAQVVWNVSVQESPQCEPDDPRLVAAFVKGTNHVPEDELDDLALHPDAVRKSDDRDGDGDPDLVEVTLEINELNGWHLESDVLGQEFFHIAPGIRPSFWVFSPKTTIHHSGDAWHDLVRLPSAPLRVEQGDELRIRVENTHYFPHTIHLHGVDHAFRLADGQGNDGVPVVSEMPVKPGEARTYVLQPREPGTYFYHCHVQPDVHVLMGLGTMLVVEEQRANNSVQTVNPGGGHVRAPSAAVREQYDREYDLVYQDADKELHEIPQSSNDPRVVSRRMHEEYKPSERDPEYFLLNGRSFPYTLRESVIAVDEDERVKLRVLNAGTETLSLHLHGHKPIMTHADGVALENPVQRDVFTITAAQRVDLELNTTMDGFNAYDRGLWFGHDHREVATTTDGINPGGDITVIAYPEFLDEETAMPVPNAGSWDLFFNPAYYRGEIPVFHMLGLPFLGHVNDTGVVDAQGAGDVTDPLTSRIAAGVIATALVGLVLWGRWRG